MNGFFYLPIQMKYNLRYTGMSRADIFAANVASAVDAAEGKQPTIKYDKYSICVNWINIYIFYESKMPMKKKIIYIVPVILAHPLWRV